MRLPILLSLVASQSCVVASLLITASNLHHKIDSACSDSAGCVGNSYWVDYFSRSALDSYLPGIGQRVVVGCLGAGNESAASSVQADRGDAATY